MKKVANRMGLVFAVAAACLMCCLISFSSGQKPEVEVRTITTLEEMRHELSHVQLNTLPTGLELVVVDGGEYLFAPAVGDLAAGMLTGALIPSESGGRRCWPVTLVEDVESRDMIIRDAEGGEAVRLPCDPDYHPDWAFDMLFPLSSHIAHGSRSPCGLYSGRRGPCPRVPPCLLLRNPRCAPRPHRAFRLRRRRCQRKPLHPCQA